MMEPTQNRSRNRFQNHSGTRSGTTDQNQNQNQTVVTTSCGWSFGHLFHPSLRSVWAGRSDEKRMGRYAAAAGGGF